MTEQLRLGFLASHRGSNMQAIVDACRSGRLAAVPAVVVSNNPGSGALERARAEGIPAYCINGKSHPGQDDQAIAAALSQHGVNLVILAGYMRQVGPRLLETFRGRIINIHPALLPDFGGKGMYGMFVHQAVIAAGVRETGVTIHVVDEHYDTGPILAQLPIPVEPGDTPETLAARVLAHEHEFYVRTLQRIVSGEITLADH